MKVRSVVEVGAFVRDARTRRGLTQAALGEAAGISEKWVSRVERGDAPNVSLAVLLSMCTALGLTLNLSEPSPALPERHRVSGIALATPLRARPAKALPGPEVVELIPTAFDRLREQIAALGGSGLLDTADDG